MGPCIQAVTITQVKGGKNGQYFIDCFYRTTELLKKFPADLVFIRDVLLKDFDFSGMEFLGMRCHFANITVHPQYFVTLIPHLDDPIAELEKIKRSEEHTSELQSLMRISYAVFCLKKKKQKQQNTHLYTATRRTKIPPH